MKISQKAKNINASFTTELFEKANSLKKKKKRKTSYFFYRWRFAL